MDKLLACTVSDSHNIVPEGTILLEFYLLPCKSVKEIRVMKFLSVELDWPITDSRKKYVCVEQDLLLLTHELITSCNCMPLNSRPVD